MTVKKDGEWISAAAAVVLLGMNPHAARNTICKRAHVGMIKARAELFRRNGQPIAVDIIPAKFWWAEGAVALDQNWATGDFETWIDDDRLEAFGVTFRRSDIERARPALVLPALEERQKMTAAGKKVFIGHGHSLVWLQLKNFLQDRLQLAIDEFNRVSTAGVATSTRLEEMLDDAAFAFLILTAEDERADGKLLARQNVVHEAGHGLVLGRRLSFSRNHVRDSPTWTVSATSHSRRETSAQRLRKYEGFLSARGSLRSRQRRKVVLAPKQASTRTLGSGGDC